MSRSALSHLEVSFGQLSTSSKSSLNSMSASLPLQLNSSQPQLRHYPNYSQEEWYGPDVRPGPFRYQLLGLLEASSKAALGQVEASSRSALSQVDGNAGPVLSQFEGSSRRPTLNQPQVIFTLHLSLIESIIALGWLSGGGKTRHFLWVQVLSTEKAKNRRSTPGLLYVSSRPALSHLEVGSTSPLPLGQFTRRKKRRRKSKKTLRGPGSCLIKMGGSSSSGSWADLGRHELGPRSQ